MSIAPDDLPGFALRDIGSRRLGRRWLDSLSPLQLYAMTVSAAFAIIGGITVFSVL